MVKKGTIWILVGVVLLSWNVKVRAGSSSTKWHSSGSSRSCNPYAGGYNTFWHTSPGSENTNPYAGGYNTFWHTERNYYSCPRRYYYYPRRDYYYYWRYRRYCYPYYRYRHHWYRYHDLGWIGDTILGALEFADRWFLRKPGIVIRKRIIIIPEDEDIVVKREDLKKWINLLEFGDKGERKKAAKKLGKYPYNKKAEAALIEALLCDPSDDVREEAAKSLGKIGSSRRALRALRKALRDEEDDVREAAEKAIGKILERLTDY